MPKTMNQYTHQYLAEQQSSSKFDETAADLTAFLDFSSFDPVVSATPAADAQSICLAPLDASAVSTSPSFTNAFATLNRSPLRPVDDALLDSPLGLELSPADSIFTTSSISGSPYDLEMSLGGDFGDASPLFGTVSYDGSPSVPAELAFPSFANLAASSSAAAGTPGTITTAELPSLFAALPLVAAHELADIKPIIPRAQSQAPVGQHAPLTRQNSTESVPFSFEDFIGDDAAQQESSPAVAASPAPQVSLPAVAEEATATRASNKRKSVAEIKREAAAKVAEKEYATDKHLGFRNTKKKMVDYDAPTLPKNYLTESATSKKRSGSTKVAASVAKRARVSSSPALPSTQPIPLDADQLDEEQLSQIELKRRQNTLAARKSRMRKAETFKVLSEEVEKLKQLNEALMAENQALKAQLGQ
ncbi:uncharacterized protein JCM15063_003076 [Sporobolomyces koalae]|uniref:uncharacterized protein n=1 Tax=Sporobolomyces koalae TaxID=500713 RepID=UPI0031731F6B